MSDETMRGFVPFTPGGSCLMHLKSKTEDGAWAKLLKDAAHMPYKGRAGFEARGYTVSDMSKWEEVK